MRRISATAAAVTMALALPVQARAQTFWDFVALNGAPASEGSPSATYASRTVTNGTLGSVSFSAVLAAGVPNSSPLVVFQWKNSEFAANDEKGVGACRDSNNPVDPGPCYTGGEVGESADIQWLIMDLTGLAPGSLLQAITIVSLNRGESYHFQVCAEAAFTTCSSYDFVSGPGDGPNIYNVALASGDQTRTFVRFGPGLGPPAQGYEGPGGYAVQGITVLSNGGGGGQVVPEPGSMSLLASGLVALVGAGVLRRRFRRG